MLRNLENLVNLGHHEIIQITIQQTFQKILLLVPGIIVETPQMTKVDHGVGLIKPAWDIVLYQYVVNIIMILKMLILYFVIRKNHYRTTHYFSKQ